MNKETRVESINRITSNEDNVCGKEPLKWGDDIEAMKVYKIPLDCLIYNKYNGRILSRTKSIEKSRGRDINTEQPEDEELVGDLLFKSNESRNSTTLKNIEKKGQLKTGIVTKDGVIIDGNRRAMLLKRLGKTEFRAIVLPIALSDNPIKIEELETTYQMGEDEKLNYNPIEKYLKAKQLFVKLTEKFDENAAIGSIADWMGETEGEIRQYLGIVDLIDRYLEEFGYEGIYSMADTPGDGKEDLFLYLKKWRDNFKGKHSSKGFDGYTDVDVEELTGICFDYIRAKIGKSYDGKMFRSIADGQQNNHFFGDKRIWTSFRDRHFDCIDEIRENVDREMPIDTSSSNAEANLSARDSRFRDEALETLKDNMKVHLTELGYKNEADRPLGLGFDAKNALSAMNRKHPSFSNSEVLDQIEEVSHIANEMLMEKSLKRLTDQISLSLSMLENVDFDSIKESKDEAAEILKEFRMHRSIEKIVYNLEKRIK